MVRIGIIGVGQQGGFYVKALNGVGMFPGMEVPKLEGGVLSAVCDIDQTKLDAIKAEYPDIAVYNDYIEMLDSGNVDAVFVVVPHYDHPTMAIEAMKRDIHVLCDKPAGVYTKAVMEMNAVAATKPNLAFAMMFNQRMNPLYQKLKEIIESGELGEIRYTDWTITTWWRPQAYYNMSAWRATWNGEGGGVLINQAPHQIDLWQWICGLPTSVFAKAGYGSHRDIPVEDDVVALVTYENGATGVFRTATHDIIGTDHFEILGDKGKLIIEGSNKITWKKLTKGETELNSEMTFEDVAKLFMGQGLTDIMSEEVFEFKDVWGLQHISVMQNFVNNINNGEPLVAHGSEGINALSVTNAMHLSSWLNKEISLPINEDLYLEELNKKIEEEKNSK